MTDNFDSYMKHKDQLNEFESYYFNLRNKAFKEKDIEAKISMLEELIAKTKEFEVFCKEVGLSKYVKEMYKEAHNAKRPKYNLFTDDKTELKKAKKLITLDKKIKKLSFEQLNAVDEYIKELRKAPS